MTRIISEESRRKMSEGSIKGKLGKKRKPFSGEWKRKIGLYQRGKKKSLETRRKMSMAHKKLVDEGIHHLWKGGLTSRNRLIHGSVEYKIWRESVFERDNYTCQECGQRGGKLEAHHIQPFSLFPAMRFVISNGQTLCVGCHKLTDTYAHKLYAWQQNHLL